MNCAVHFFKLFILVSFQTMQNQLVLIGSDELASLHQKLDHLIKVLSDGTGVSQQQLLGKWITEEEAQKMLSRGTTTLWKMRNKGILESTEISNKVYYNREQIMALLNNNTKKAFNPK
jgi:hypothetical protein